MSDTVRDYQVIIVGAGFAGVAAAQRLAKERIRTLLIDRNNYQQFQPLLYQVATAQLAANDVAAPLRSLFRKHPSVRVLTAEVSSIDARDRSVTLPDGTVFRSDVLVISAGAEVNYFGTPGADEFSYPLYSVDDATALASSLVEQLDRADTAAATHGDCEPIDVVVVGGGPTGVETAGAIGETIERVLPHYFHDAVPRRCTVHLVDHGDTVLKPFSEKLQRYTRRSLERLGVVMLMGTGVSEVRADGVTLSDGSTLPAHVVVWAGGLKARSVVASAGLETGRGGRVDVDADLTAPGVPGVYVLGDAANIPDGSGGTLPQLGSVAMQSGKWAGRNIVADLTGGQRRPFGYVDKGFMAMIGRMSAVAEVGPKRIELTGPLAFASWLAVHAALLPQARARIGALASWPRDYLSRSRSQFVVGNRPR
ncbi:NAD(P)/FAD-dependent oxidoreductase [Gordonia humi]|uniref:NADH dehydrogenase n=1 Tax=Gordonia humi TaxID=686429 RepID=A0A840F0Y7_9ACTN|nr:NAD(P)/FAD-dependent oxidoreductase [Gordonia humi]MBB4137541.1 NADH dehydrogenase [Gordonia humi]